MNRKTELLVIAFVLATAGLCWWILSRETRTEPGTVGEFLGSTACRDCHERFYEKWATSWHGLAMQPYTPEFARKNLTPSDKPITMRGRTYRVDISGSQGLVLESGPDGEKAHLIAHVMGGKNLYYFLTPFPGGRLQVLPVAYDTHEKSWYNTTTSMVRHFDEDPDEAVDWWERPLTFNTSCYSCHVSQLSRNYDFETDSYNTTWGEPGINCESCHGPGRKHVEVALAAGDGVPDPLETIVTRDFTHAQTNAMCAHCHAKMVPLTEEFLPGERFFDHFNLATLEDRDLHPDGRELGENYTFGPSLISPCVASGQLDCMHCHTSSGRNRHTGENADRACLPCHAELVENAAAHSFHEAGSEGSRCVSCHMPETVFARMRRHDHTMQPPTPSATIEFKSPNACNLCHEDKDAKWADEWVRKWYPRDYQAPILERARLVHLARNGNWARLPDMLAYIRSEKRNEMYASGLLRLLRSCPDPVKWPTYISAARDPSPLVRASAVTVLADCPEPEGLQILLEAAGDATRLVRVQAAGALARYPVEQLEPKPRKRVERAFEEHVAFLMSRADDPTRHYNLGNFYQDRGRMDLAVKSYEDALELQPDMVPALVNLSMVHARRGDPRRAEDALRQALREDPTSSEANFNMGLLLAEQGRTVEAESCLRTALKKDPKFAEAAYNLAVLLAEEKPSESIELCRKAMELRPDDPRYGYTLAFYLYAEGETQEALQVLQRVLENHPNHGDSLAFLGRIYEESGRAADALQVYRSALSIVDLPPELHSLFASRVAAIEGG